MKRKILISLLTLAACVTDASAQDVVLKYSGRRVKVTNNMADSVAVTREGAHVVVSSSCRQHELTVSVSGRSRDGSLKLVTDGKATLRLSGLNLKSKEGAVLWLKNKKRVEIVADGPKASTLTIKACKDTANHKSAAIWAKGKVHFSGDGTLNVTAVGDGCKGINVKDDVKISDLTLNVVTRGQNLGVDTSGRGFHMPEFDPAALPDSVRKRFGNGGPGEGFPPPPFGERPEGAPDFGHSPGGFGAGPGHFGAGPGPSGERPEGAPGFGGGPDGMRGQSGDPDEKADGGIFKQRYLGKTKALRAEGVITVESGTLYCKTASAGAEGVEGKQGITVNGGKVTVDAIDDALNANGEIRFNGGVVVAESHCNDAVDANMSDGGMPPFFGQGGAEMKPLIIVSGGEVYAWSHVGAPEEGLDSDFAPIAISGGCTFSIGAGMGEMPSVPTEQTAEQPTVLLTGLQLQKGALVQVLDGNDVVWQMTTPFSFRGSSTLLSLPAFKSGRTYTFRTAGQERTFTFDANFVIARQ